MTENKHFKALVRARKARSGESYQQARAALLKRQTWFTKMDRTPVGKRVREWMQEAGMVVGADSFMGECPHNDIRATVNIAPSYANFETAIQCGVKEMKNKAREAVTRTSIRRSFEELKLCEELDVFVGAGMVHDAREGICLYFVDKRNPIPIVYRCNPFLMHSEHYDAMPEETRESFHDALLQLGRSYTATDADNGSLSMELMDDDPFLFFDAGGLSPDFYGVELRWVTNPDHIVIEDGIPYCDGGVLIGINDDDEETVASLVHADELFYARQAVAFYYELREVDRQLRLLMGEEQRQRLALALMWFEEGGIAALPIAAPMDVAGPPNAPGPLEALLQSPEGEEVDFKERHYRIASATEDEKSEFLKDVLAFANTPRSTEARHRAWRPRAAWPKCLGHRHPRHGPHR